MECMENYNNKMVELYKKRMNDLLQEDYDEAMKNAKESDPLIKQVNDLIDNFKNDLKIITDNANNNLYVDGNVFVNFDAYINNDIQNIRDLFNERHKKLDMVIDEVYAALINQPIIMQNDILIRYGILDKKTKKLKIDYDIFNEDNKDTLFKKSENKRGRKPKNKIEN